MLDLCEGDLPQRAKKMIAEWGMQNQKELMEIWEKQEFCNLPPLK